MFFGLPTTSWSRCFPIYNGWVISQLWPKDPAAISALALIKMQLRWTPFFGAALPGPTENLSPRSLESTPIDGVMYDTEHYAGGIMYLHNGGFSDATFEKYLTSHRVGVSITEVPAGSRYDFLRQSGRLREYYNFLEEQAYQQGRELSERWHAINPHLVFGVWPMLENWFSQGFLRGLGGAVPSLGLSGVEYYHGADQSRSMAELFESRSPNLLYMPGFYPPYAYSVGQLQEHVALALRKVGRYWMLGPHQELPQPEYQAALRNAFEEANLPIAEDLEAVNLDYRVERKKSGSVLVVQLDRARQEDTPLLSLWSTFGGAPLCRKRPMRWTDQGVYEARIPLLRRMTNNRHQSRGFRSGSCYRYEPLPFEFRYEDPHHTKLIDGRAYGYFGTTVAWPKSIDQAQVVFDLHREFQIERVEVAQPAKLEDRIGGPARMNVQLGRQRGQWGTPKDVRCALPGLREGLLRA